MAAAPDQVDLDDFYRRTRPLVQGDPIASAHLVDVVLELQERRQADSPKRSAKLARLRFARRRDAALAAEGVARSERVRQLEQLGFSRTLAYQLTRPENVDDASSSTCESP